MKTTLGVVAREYHGDTTLFGAKTFLLQEMAQEAQSLNIELVVFSPLTWQPGEFEINGYSFCDGAWVANRYIMPKTLYYMFIARTKEKTVVSEFNYFLRQNSFCLLNPFELVFLVKNKILFYDFLINNNISTIQSILIEDASEDVLDNFLNYNNCVYIKPIKGYGGRGIAILKQDQCNRESLYLMTKSCTVIHRKDLLETLKAKFNSRSYILQPKAKVFELDDSHFDVRVLVQNSGYANYQVTGMGIRIGGKNSWITNIKGDGKAMSIYELRKFYQSHYNKSLDSEIIKITNICLECCYKMHEKVGSFDILLTLDKGPLILEANSQPGRKIFKAIASLYEENSTEFLRYKELRRTSIRLPLIFALNNS
jgi:glutathione synthase/RimK-type ligase-like ATP-grasp enzyme